MRRTWILIGGAGCLTALVALCVAASVTGVFLWARQSAPQVQAAAVNRIALVGDDGNLYTIRPDGSDRHALTDDASSTRRYSSPTWSPDGARLAWVEVSANEGSPSSALHLRDIAAARTTRTETPFPPFYLFWSPDSRHLAYLSNWTDSLALRVVDVGNGGTLQTIGEGQPFYFSWAPTGDRLFAHIGPDDLAFITLDGKRTDFPISAGATFAAPQWSPDGEHLAYATQEGGERALRISDLQGRTVQTVATFAEGSISFTWSPDAQKMAYIVTTEQVGTTAYGPLMVVDLSRAEAYEVSAEPVLGFFWSPDSRHLIFPRLERHAPVTPIPEASTLLQSESTIWLRWHVWNGERTYPLSIFFPSRPFVFDYLRFFDQYAQSLTFWSPAGDAFIYTGLGESGLQGVWHQPIAEGSSPTRISRGVQAAWSPR